MDTVKKEMSANVLGFGYVASKGESNTKWSCHEKTSDDWMECRSCFVL